MFQSWQLTSDELFGVECVLFASSETKTEAEEEVTGEVKKRVPLSLEELLAKKKAEEEAQSKVREIFSKYFVNADFWFLHSSWHIFVVCVHMLHMVSQMSAPQDRWSRTFAVIR